MSGVGQSSSRSPDGDHGNDRRDDVAWTAEDEITVAKRTQVADEATPLIGKSAAGIVPQDADREYEARGDFDGLPWHKRPSIYWMLPPYLLFTMAFGGMMVPKLNLVLTLVCREYFAELALVDPTFSYLPVIFGKENEQCRIPQVQSRVAKFNLVATVIAGILSAIVSPKLGAISDRYGRKLIIVLSNIGMFLAEIVTILTAKYSDTVSVNWILLGYAFDGICGSFITAMALAHSYATDCTPPSKRNVAFGYFHGCLFTGIAIGPIIAGYIVKKTGSILSVFYIGIAAHVTFIAFLIFFIPESLSKSRQLAAREKYRAQQLLEPPRSFWSAFSISRFLEPLSILRPKGPGASPMLRNNLFLLAAVDTLGFGVAMGAVQVIVIYSNYMFGWDTYTQSVYISIVNTTRVLGLIIVLPLLNSYVRRWLKGTTAVPRNGSDRFELNIVRVALLFDSFGFLGYTLSRNGVLFIVSGIITACGGLGAPTLQSILTKHVPADKTGQLLGALGLLHALARVISPIIFNGIYSATVGKFTPLVFICLTATFFLAFLCSLFVRSNVYLLEDVDHFESHDHSDPSDEEAVENDGILGSY